MLTLSEVTKTDKDASYRLQVNIDEHEINVISSAHIAGGINVTNVSRVIDSRFNTKTTCVYLFGNLSAQANSFNMCAVRLNSTKVCENTIRERELVLLNFKM